MRHPACALPLGNRVSRGVRSRAAGFRRGGEQPPFTGKNTVAAGFIHPEGRGVVAIDQGACGPNAAEIRLYIRPGDRIVFLIAIGDKRSQQADIARAHQFVEQMRRNR